MTFFQGLFAARSHLAFLVGLALALAVAWSVDQSTAASLTPGTADYGKVLPVKRGGVPKLRKTGVALTEQEKEWARIAYRYFENNYRPETGLVNSVDGYPSATLWDLASYMMGLLSAEELGIADKSVVNERLDKLLSSLETLQLVDGIAPNKAYNTQTLKTVDYNNQESKLGVGWSALDVARIGVPLTLIVWTHPEHTARVRSLLSHWHLEQIVKDGQMIGTQRKPDGTLERLQEGRFGYEQYAAKSLFLLGQDVSRSLRYDADVEVTTVSGQPIAHDARTPDKHGGAHNAAVSEPYILEAIEFGLSDDTTLPLTRALYAAQRNRFEESGILTAVSEDNIDRAPYFIYGSVLNDGKPWSTFAPDGSSADAHRLTSLKAALGFGYLFGDGYADKLRAGMSDAYDVNKGWYSGKYEKDGSLDKAITANTNGIVLEILLYKTKGPLLRGVTRAPAAH